MILVELQFLYLLTDQGSLLEQLTMIMHIPEVTMTTEDMFVFMITIHLLKVGYKLEQILKGKPELTIVENQFLYLLTDQD